MTEEKIMPHIHVKAIEGRSEEEKMRIAKALTAALMESANVPKEACYVTFDDIERKNWLEYDKENISKNPDVLFIYKGDATK